MTALHAETEFHIRTFVRDVLIESAETEPRAIAELVLGKLSDDEIRSALTTVLPGFIRVVINNMAGENRRAAQPRQTLTTPQRIAADWHARTLADRVNVGDAWKLFGELTVDDLHNAAAIRYKAAAATQHEADRFTDLANLLDDLGGATVADIPEDALRRVWIGAE